VDTNLKNFMISMIVLFPLVSGLVRLRTISRLYRPFILLMAVAFLTEVINYIIIDRIRNNSASINFYSLAESLLIISQFYFWRYYSRTRRWYPYFGVLCIAIWVFDNLVNGNVMMEVGSLYRISAAFILVVLSINEINYLIINDSRNVLKNARFLICTGFLIYFLYQILLEGSIYISQRQKNIPASEILQLAVYVNIFVTIIYGIAVWFIPKRISLSLQERIEN
jgi:hypothetical protein